MKPSRSSMVPRGYALASQRVAQEGRPVRFMYREAPRDERDNGWVFFCGDEDQRYADNPDNLGVYAVTTIAEIDPSIVPFLSTEPPCAFERETLGESFRPSTNFTWAPEE